MSKQREWTIREKQELPMEVNESSRRRGDFHLIWLNDSSFVITCRYSMVYMVYSCFMLNE